jgi:hypothetical protein
MVPVNRCVLRTRNRLVRIWFVNDGFDVTQEPNSPKSAQIGCRRLLEQKAFRFSRRQMPGMRAQGRIELEPL